MNSPLQDILSRLPLEHARALEWFVDHEGEVGPRPWRVDGASVVPGVSIPLVAQRGIHQPSGWDVALSITATQASMYLDGAPQQLEDGTWVLPYRAHEGREGAGAGSRWNRALIRNRIDRVPVGVFVPAGRGYLNLGLAMVEHFYVGTSTFLLRGPMRYSQNSSVWDEESSTGLSVGDEVMKETLSAILLSREVDDPVRYSQVRQRVAQQTFRDELLSAYRGTCAITGYRVREALQGAHILEYSGRSSQVTANGLLLRADVHLLFDRHLMSVHPGTRTVALAPTLMSTPYAGLQGALLGRPSSPADAPDPNRLSIHWAVFERGASRAG